MLMHVSAIQLLLVASLLSKTMSNESLSTESQDLF